ncbi:MAG TPA: type II toxin-antitoxin system RelE/ParE family toxin [Pyrinomonadaceae bacterium]|jgi:plasmid stabilization system protein ParE
MKKYKVILHSDAETDISSAFEWGRHAWGEETARTWLRQLYRNLRERLTSTPLRCPVAPESEELGIPVRQLIDGRYRILFIVEKKTVTILHLKGAYVGGSRR